MAGGALAGAAHLGRGLAWWRSRPRLMLLGVLPALLVLVVVGAGLVALLLVTDDLVAAATPFADDWATGLRTVLRVGLGLALLLAAGFLATVTFTAIVLAVGDPFYEHIWRRAEASLGGEVPGAGLGMWRSLRDSGALLLVGLASGLMVLVLGLLPVVGAAAGAALGILVAGRLLAAELLSRPLEARGMDRRARARLLAAHRAEVLGFGVVTQLCFLVPLGAVLVMPAAVVGATGLARDLLADPAAMPGQAPSVPPRSV